MKTIPPDPLLKTLETELAERILRLAAFLDAAFLPSQVGNNLIKLVQDKEVEVFDSEPNQIDLPRFRIGRTLPYLYNYAHNARCIDVHDLDWGDWMGDGIDSVFKDFLAITDIYGIRVADGNQEPDWGSDFNIDPRKQVWNSSPLWEMIFLGEARHKLDFEEELSIADIALLSGMNEKSVRNALRGEGEHQLVSEDGENVKSSEALRWLRGRKSGFRETTFVKFDNDALPDSLTYVEIPSFIKSRLEKIHGEYSWWCDSDERLGYSGKTLANITTGRQSVPIEDVIVIAKALQVDPAWFSEQVFSAYFPEQMELILYKKSIEFEVITEQQEKPFIDVALTEKGIKNGYIDIPAKFSDFFPKDCFADRATGSQGEPIELRFGTEVRSTDIRVKSAITISPRARFGGYFNKVIEAKPGDIVRIIKLDERVFELKYMPVG